MSSKKEASLEIPDNYKDIESFDVRHLPIIRAFCDKIDISHIIERALDAKMECSPGKIVTGLILDTLAGRNPLYRVRDFFSHQDTELVVGEGMKACLFSDDTIARVLDRIFNYGTQKLFSEISLKAVKEFNIDTTRVHHDSTSVSVWGDYINSEEGPIILNNGYSKDKRPDLKQFIFSLLCSEKDIPIAAKIYSGNTDDKTISKNILGRISKYMAAYTTNQEGFVFVADSALVARENLKVMGGTGDSQKIKFISRMPATFNIVGTLIKEAVAKNTWDDIGKCSGQKNSAYYKSYECKTCLDDKAYRTVVFHSDFYDARKLKRIDAEIEKDKKEAEKIQKKLTQIEFFCRKDAEMQAGKEKAFKYHKLKWDCQEKKIYGRGRPKNGEKEVGQLRYTLNVNIASDDNLIDKLKEQAGCFVLISNVAYDKYSAVEILKIYKEQYGIEKNFGFLKDPLIVNDLFLKKPERIEALGFILVLSLLVWRLLERCTRKYIKEKNTTITGWDKKQTKSPTTFMMTTKFCSVHVLKLGSKRWLSRKASSTQKEYLDALGLSEEIFYEVVS